MDGTTLILIRSGAAMNISHLVESVTWKGRKGAAARQLDVTLLDDDNRPGGRVGIDAETGCQVIFSHDGAECFRGLILSHGQSQSKAQTFTAYDNGIYLTNNKDTFIYENKTASDIFRDVCKRLNLDVGSVADCEHTIAKMSKPGATPWDVITDALAQDYDATGVRHYVQSWGGKLHLLNRRDHIVTWAMSSNQNITAYNYKKSIEKTKTRVKIVDNNGTSFASASIPRLENAIGIFGDAQSKPDDNKGSLNELARTMLEESGLPQESLSVTSLGNDNVIAGYAVYCVIPEIGFGRTFYVDEDTHTYNDRYHQMSLTLNFFAENGAAEGVEVDGDGGGDFAVGDIVMFHGAPHYISSDATNPTGSPPKPGLAKITLIAKGAKHPWHLIHTNSDSRVYGWVDDGTFSRQ